MDNVKVGCIPLGMYMTNCYYVYNVRTNEAVVIDPADSGDYIFDELSKKGLSVKAIFLTHGHFDHIYGVSALKEKTGVKVYSHEEEADLLASTSLNCSGTVGRKVSVTPDILLKDSETVKMLDCEIKLLYTPGHTKGSACYYFESEGIIFAGDTLFYESVGRTDLPTGSMSELIRSIKDVLMPLPDEVTVFPGHGESTSIGHERNYNPFL